MSESLDESERRRRFESWMLLLEQRGQRYKECYLGNYEVSCDEQHAALSAVATYAGNVVENVANGCGLVLFGPSGTGKDHLVMGVAQIAIREGVKVHWVNGVEFFAQIRDAISEGQSDVSLVRELVRPQVLWISDPVPPFGALEKYRAETLFRVLDARYSAMKPTWITINVSGATELEERCGVQNAGRMKHNSLTVWCSWPEYRKSLSAKGDAK